MSQKGNPAIIGLFVIGAVIVLIVTVVTLGNISFDEDRYNCVLYFKGSLHGLNEGSPVTYRGIKIGKVADIAIIFDPEDEDYQTPVYVDIDRENLGRAPGSKDQNKDREEKFIQDMIDKGLRAELKMQSLVTGQLYIDFAFHPETEPHYKGTEGDYLEIPTLPSRMEQLTSTLANLELESLINRAVDALENLNWLLTSESTQKLIDNFYQTFEHLDDLILTTDRNLPRLVDRVQDLTEDFNDLTTEIDKSLEQGRQEFGPFAADLRTTLTNIDRAAAVFAGASENVSQMTDRNSRLSYELYNAMKEVRKAADSVRALADLLQRNPEILLYGPREEGR